MPSITIKKLFPFFNLDLLTEIKAHSTIRQFPANTELIKDGYYVTVLPVVITGIIKVFTRYDDKELLLYYIDSGETCIMSFDAGLTNKPSQIYAVTETDTEALLLPIDKVVYWAKKHPEFNLLMFKQYSMRYRDLHETIQMILFNNMDKRLLKYLTEKAGYLKGNLLKISHKQIASELGTVREVISRVMKKLENEGWVKQEGNAIKILK